MAAEERVSTMAPFTVILFVDSARNFLDRARESDRIEDIKKLLSEADSELANLVAAARALVPENATDA